VFAFLGVLQIPVAGVEALRQEEQAPNSVPIFLKVGLVSEFVLVVFGMIPWIAIAPIDTATVPLLARIVNP